MRAFLYVYATQVASVTEYAPQTPGINCYISVMISHRRLRFLNRLAGGFPSEYSREEDFQQFDLDIERNVVLIG
jgi:hypothetical protein